MVARSSVPRTLAALRKLAVLHKLAVLRKGRVLQLPYCNPADCTVVVRRSHVPVKDCTLDPATGLNFDTDCWLADEDIRLKDCIRIERWTRWT